LVLGVALLGVTVAVACGSDGDVTPGGSSGSSGSSGDQSSGILGGAGDGGDPNADGGGNNPGDCKAPVDMYIMLDRSKSMSNDQNQDGNIGETGTKWERAITALSGYFHSDASKDQAAALQFFPLDTHSSALCTTGAQYDKARLPNADPFYTTLPSPSFDKTLNDEKPSNGAGETPTEAAINGMTRFTAANRRPGRVTIGILITDGDPRGCNTDRDELSDMLKAHYDATKIRTYVIGMQGASFDNLERIAEGGGTPEHGDNVNGLKNACGGTKNTCRHWNVGDGNPEGFTAALKAIQDSADGCKPGGGVINPPK
jgi:hypothetical protein